MFPLLFLAIFLAIPASIARRPGPPPPPLMTDLIGMCQDISGSVPQFKKAPVKGETLKKKTFSSLNKDKVIKAIASFNRESPQEAEEKYKALEGFFKNLAPAQKIDFKEPNLKVFRKNYNSSPDRVLGGGRCVQLEKFGKYLYFLGADHIGLEPDPQKQKLLSNSHKTAWEKARTDKKIQMVILEGIPSRLGISPCFIAIQSVFKGRRSVNEVDQLIRWSMLHGIPFIGGAIRDNDMLHAIQKSDYMKQYLPESSEKGFDLANEIEMIEHFQGFYGFLISRLSEEYYRRRGRLNLSKEFFKRKFKEVDYGPSEESEQTWIKFLAWYSRRVAGSKDTNKGIQHMTKVVKDPRSFNPPLFAPVIMDKKDLLKTPYTNRLVALQSAARNAHLYKLMDHFNQNKQKTLVQYGSGHLWMLRPTLTSRIRSPKVLYQRCPTADQLPPQKKGGSH